MADRLPGARRDFVGVLQDTKKAQAATRRPTSALRVGEWVIESRPAGLHITHGPSGETTLLAAAPTDEEVQA